MLMPNVIVAAASRDVQIQTSLVEDIVFSGFAVVGFRLEASGPPYNEQTQEGDGAPYVTVGPWVLAGVPTDYEVNYSGTGVTPSGSPVNTWIDFSLSREWRLTANLVIEEFTGTISIRRAVGGAIVLQQPLTLLADGSP